jgi:hypothetical protein
MFNEWKIEKQLLLKCSNKRDQQKKVKIKEKFNDCKIEKIVLTMVTKDSNIKKGWNKGKVLMNAELKK